MPFTPNQYQTKIDPLSYIQSIHSIKGNTDFNLDVLFVGGGPAGLAGAIRLRQLCQRQIPKANVNIAVMDKARHIGGHALSGAIINPSPFQKLFPDITPKDLPFRQKVKTEKLFYLSHKKKYILPLPPTMKNKNFYTASLCEVIRWMAKKAEAMDISLLPAFTAYKLLTEGEQIKGVLTFPTGLSKNKAESSATQEAFPVCAKLTVLADGSRGHLSQAWMQWKNISSKYAQTYALGVKELWEVKNNFSEQHQVIHTMGWPLQSNCFGGGWLYPMGKNMVSLGLVAGLDSSSQNLDVHQKLQDLKTHPLFSKILKAGRCVEWGAKTIPEGGYHSIPETLHDHGLLIAGDAGGMVNVPALKGIHYAMTSGLLAAETAFTALKNNNFSSHTLKSYSYKIRQDSPIKRELYPVRNVRQAFHKHLLIGLIKSGLMFLTKGFFPGDSKKPYINKQDADHVRIHKDTYYTHKTTHSHSIRKTDAVYLSGNQTRDDIPLHLKNNKPLPEEVQKFYEHLCPANVYESKNKELIINAPNCIDCKATDILGPRWTPKEGGTGPNYRRM